MNYVFYHLWNKLRRELTSQKNFLEFLNTGLVDTGYVYSVLYKFGLASCDIHTAAIIAMYLPQDRSLKIVS